MEKQDSPLYKNHMSNSQLFNMSFVLKGTGCQYGNPDTTGRQTVFTGSHNLRAVRFHVTRGECLSDPLSRCICSTQFRLFKPALEVWDKTTKYVQFFRLNYSDLRIFGTSGSWEHRTTTSDDCAYFRSLPTDSSASALFRITNGTPFCKARLL